MPPSVARMSLVMIPGQSVALGSAEGETIEIKRNVYQRS
jgi:hypothetical protein